MIRRAFGIMICLLLFARIGLGAETALSGTVRVSLTSLTAREEIHISFDGSYTIGSETPINRGSVGVVRAEGNTVSLFLDGMRAAQGKQIYLRRHLSAGENGLRIAEARIPANLYPGDLLITGNDGCVQPVAYLYMEDYLPGVLPYEMDDTFPLEALKAQAIAARTYALRKMALQGPDYDLVDTTADQVYCGTPPSSETCARAISETWGVVGLANGGFMPTYYTASNGGQTESAEHAWGGRSSYSFPIQDDPYDLANANSAVRSVVFFRNGTTSSEGLTALLRARAARLTGKTSPVIRGITSVRLGQPKYPSPSRLYTALTVTLTVEGYGEVEATFDYFSEIEALCDISLNVLDNELLDVEEGERGFRLNARRLGHGVGMSQRGAEEMANRGSTAAEILAFYYPGAELRKYTLTRQILPAIDASLPPLDAPVAEAVQLTVMPGHALDVSELRSAPRQDAPVLLRLNYGSRVVLLADGSEYSLVQSGLTAGYVKNSDLRTENELPETPEPEEGETVVRVQLADEEQMLNLRAAPNTTAEVIGHLRKGERLLLLMSYGSWSCVRFGDTIGFVKSEYIEPEVRTASETAAQEIETSGIRAIVLPEEGTGLYADADSSSFLYLHLPQGTALDVSSLADSNWIAASLGGLPGYVPRDALYLTFTDDSAVPEQFSDSVPAEAAIAVPIPAVTPASAQAPEDSIPARVRADRGLMLRSAPSGSSDSILVMPDGAALYILSFDIQNGYVRVSYEGNEGYAAIAYLERVSEEEAPAAAVETTTPVPPASRVISRGSGEEKKKETQVSVQSRNGLHLRASPRSDGESLYVLPFGTVVTVTGPEVNGFLPVRWGGYWGYIAAVYTEALP